MIITSSYHLVREGRRSSVPREFSLLGSLLCYTTSSLSNLANYRPHQELAPLVPISSVFSPSPLSFLSVFLPLWLLLSMSRLPLDRSTVPTHVSLSTVCFVSSFHRRVFFSRLSPLPPSSSVFSVTFNSDPSVPRSSPCLATLSTFLFPPTSTPVSLSLFFCYIQAHHSLFLYLLSLLTLIFACPCLSPPHSFYRLSPFLLVFYVVLVLLLLLFPLLPPLCALEFCSVSLARTRVRQGGGPRALATPVTRG